MAKNGYLIFEAFSKKHLTYKSENPNVGEPNDLADLFSKEEIQIDFQNFEILELKETEVELNEGKYRGGKGSVIQFWDGKNKNL